MSISRDYMRCASSWLFAMISLLGLSAPALAQSFTTTTTGNIDDTVLCAGHGGTGGTIGNLTRTINVTGGPTSIADLNVGLLATHTWRGDIRLDITSPGPSPVTVRLINSDTSTVGNVDDYNVELGDEAADLVNTGSASGPHDTTLPVYDIPARPNNALSAFNGRNSNGTWTLTMCDDYVGETGQFLQATLFIASASDADLSLTASIDDAFPQFNSTVTLTYTATNAGPSATTGVTASIPLPADFTVTSTGGTGTFAGSTWSIPGTLASGSSATLTITGTVGTVAQTINAEIASSSGSDSDSTPGNNSTTEDDDVSLSIFPQPPATPPSLTCSAASQFTHAWTAPGTTSGWTSGDTTDSYTASGVPLTFTISGDTANLGAIGAANTVVTQNQYTGGVVPAEFSLGIAADHATASQEILITADIGTPGEGVEALQFSAFDIDLGGWVDRLTVTGEINGTTVMPTLTPSSRNYISGNSAIGRVGNADTTEATGNVVITFNSPVDKVIIAYGNDPSVGADPAFQIMSIHEMTMCPRLLADVAATKSVEVYDPGNLGLYMTPGNEVLYKITVVNSASAAAPANDIDIADTLPDTVRFISASTTGFTSGAFGSPALPAANDDCAGGACVIRYSNATLPINTTGEIIVRAVIK